MKKIFSVSCMNIFVVLFFGLLITPATALGQTVYFSDTANTSSVVEGGTFTLNVKLTGPSTTDTVINIVSTPDTADTSDFTPVTTTVTIPAGQTIGTTSVSIPTTSDSTIEPTESFTVNGTVTSGNTNNGTTFYVVYINDNDTIPDFIVYETIFITESNHANFYYSLSNPYSSDVIVQWTSVNGNTDGSDFPAINNTITIPAGQTNGFFTVYTTDDTMPEPDEFFTLTATVTSGNTTNTTQSSIITIRDNDTTPTFSVRNNVAAPSEGQNYYLYVTLDRPFNSSVTVQITTADGTAGSGDYTAISITKTFAPGSTFASVSIPISEDLMDEPYEFFTVTGIVTSGNTTNSTDTSNIYITDNDGLPDVYFLTNYDASSIGLETVEEGQNATFGIGLTQPRGSDTVVQITTANGTAGSADYTSFTTTITIPEGRTHYYSSDLFIPTVLDQLQEGDETFSITATLAPGLTYYPSYTQTVNILDNYNLNAQEDNVSVVAEVSSTFNLLANDTLHGLSLNTADAIVTLAANPYGITANPQGVISIPGNLDIGYYNLNYTICETANPGNCDSAVINLTVKSPLDVSYNLTYSDYNGDGYTSVGDIITYQFNVTNNGNAPITNVDVNYSYNLNITGGPIAVLNAGQTDTTTFTAVHIVTQNDINFGFHPEGDNQGQSFIGDYYGYEVEGWSYLQNPFTLNISDGIRLKAFVDTNGNGTQDVFEINFPLGHFTYEINNNGTLHNVYTTPFYLYESNPATTYSLNYQVDADYAANNNCIVSYLNVTIAPGSGITNYNFPITVTPYQDLSVNIHNFGASPRPGFPYYSYITYTNNSNQVYPAGTLTFTKDPAISIVTVCDGNAVLNSTGFTYDFVNLQPYETRTFWLQMAVPTIPTVSLGQTLTNSVAITLPVGDIHPANNTSSVTEIIVGSYDPNDKTETHGGRIVQSSFSANDYLTYTIRFENTGTANAINVKVSDVLDAKLDETSIKMISASHAYVLERVNSSLTWNFFGIDLPPSVPDTSTGHGYIVFQVKPKPGYTVGDIIENTAEIYFDFNPAIVTNTCTTEFVQTLSNDAFAFDNFSYSPNPVKDVITISNNTALDEIAITSVLGQKVLSQKCNDLQIQINLQGLTNGVYFITARSLGQLKTFKIVKE